jgi:capsular exopolysaccharide synthesis family protein
LITSSIPREGKTTTALNIGVTLAETGGRTLLIDADFRNPSVSQRFGISNGKGLSVHLAGGSVEIRDSHIPNLFILPAGPKPPNPVALFASQRFAEMLQKLSQDFRFIIFDGPPILGLGDVPLIAAKVDGVILVIKASGTPKEVVARASLQLERAGANILGAAINHLSLSNPDYSHYSKYYAYPYAT